MDITSDPQVTAALAAIYDSVDDIDLWLGAIAEDAIGGGLVGELLSEIIIDQFVRTRDGDRFFYENDRDLLALFPAIDQTSLSEIIVRNSTMDTMPSNVFLIPEPTTIALGVVALCMVRKLQ